MKNEDLDNIIMFYNNEVKNFWSKNLFIYIIILFVFILLYIVKEFITGIPFWGLIFSIIILSFPLGIASAYHTAIKKTVSSLTFRKNGFIHRYLSGRIFMLIKAFLSSVFGSIVLIISLLTITKGEFAIIASGILLFPVVYRRACIKVFNESVPWIYCHRSLIWSKFIIISFIFIMEIIFIYITTDNIPTYRNLQEAIDSHHLIITKSSLLNLALLSSNWLSILQDYLPSCITKANFGDVKTLDILIMCLFNIAQSYYFINLIEPIFIPKSEIRRIFISDNIDSLNIPKIKPSAIVFYSFMFSILVLIIISLSIAVESYLKKDYIAKNIENANISFVNKAILIDGVFYNGELVSVIESINSKYQLAIKKIDSRILSSNNRMCLKMQDNVDDFLDWFYSLKAEYLRLIHIMDPEDYMKEKIGEYLEKGIDFDAMKELIQMRDDTLQDWKQEIENTKLQYEIPKDEAKSFRIIQISPDVLQAHSRSEYTNFPYRMMYSGSSAGVGAGISAAVTAKIMSKPAVKAGMAAAAKVAAKVGSKAGSSVLGAAGAVIGGAIGSVIPFFGTAVGATIGGIISAAGFWVGTDLAVLSLEEAISRDDFRKAIMDSIAETCKNPTQAL